VTVRTGGRVRQHRFVDLTPALEELERQGHSLQGRADRDAVGGALVRRFEPEQQVTARIELSGPGRLRAGVDVRGDGSAVPFTGRVRRTRIERADRESAYDALRRVVGH
jgi:hypothetical protein